MHIAMIGTRGVPARYGGFETCVEEVGKRLADRGHHVTVYCRDEQTPDTYLRMSLVHRAAIRHRTLETLSHTLLSVGHAILPSNTPDVALVFNAANAPVIPMLRARRIPVATHVDGLEWKRAKWGPGGRHYYRRAEELSVRWSDALIADAQGIADYYLQEFGAPTRLISYGAKTVTARAMDLGHGLRTNGFHLVVSRFEPENHVLEIVRGYSRSNASKPLAVVGSAPYSALYTKAVRDEAGSQVVLMGSVWDQDLLDQLYAQCLVYWHGHSVGGTNPSLLRAIGAGAATNAYDVPFNQEVARESGRYWVSCDDVTALVHEAESDTSGLSLRRTMARVQAMRYDWDVVAAEYESLCEDLAGGGLRRDPSLKGQRLGAHHR